MGDAASAMTVTLDDDHKEDCTTPPVIELNDNTKNNLADILNSKGTIKTKDSKKSLKKYKYKRF